MSSSAVNLAKSWIPLTEIQVATNYFSPEALIGVGGQGGKVYIGKLSERWQNRTAAFKRLVQPTDQGNQVKHEFNTEVEVMSSLNHGNIIDFIGYCDEDNEMIIVFEYATNGSLDQHISMCSLTWVERLKICLGLAKGLEYLRSGLGEGLVLIQRNIRSPKVLLDDNLEAKICGFGLSVLVDRNKPQVNESVQGNKIYMDPIYKASGILEKESDVYSFGVVVFEILSGMLVSDKRIVGDNQPQSLINLVRRYSDHEADNLIDPRIRHQVNMSSFHVLKEIACQCISWNLKERPGMRRIIKRIKKALDIQVQGEASTIISLGSHLENFVIPLEEITLATEHFSPESHSGDGGSCVVYKGQISERWGNRTAAFKRIKGNVSHVGQQTQQMFSNEVEMMSKVNHENIIPFIGYCDQSNEMIIVSEYASNGNLGDLLKDDKKRACLTWTQRLRICLGVARGLEYLHSGLEGVVKVIHRDIKSANILLDDKLEAKICDFAFSQLVHRNQTKVYDLLAGTRHYLDPIHEESGIINTELDVYSFGVVMLEMLSGTLASDRRTFGDHDLPRTLMHFVRHYHDKGVDILIDPLMIKNEIDFHSLNLFMKTVYRCTSLNLKHRPTMKRIVNRIEASLDYQNDRAASTIGTRSQKGYLIPLNNIEFNLEKPVGKGGFGTVYKGQIRASGQTVAIKSLHPEVHEVKMMFENELRLFSNIQHQNIIPFVGYCNEGGRMILVSEYAINGSLDDVLSDEKKRAFLKWPQRLKICLGAAKGLDYLHSGLENKIIIHRDFKSGNILLDENIEAKICDFGMSKEDLRNHTQIHTRVAGTNCYMDPIYHGSRILRKESDVYSFGVVMFEILSGRLAADRPYSIDGKSQPLITHVRENNDNEPEKLIDPFIKNEINSRCFHAFREIAYQCISFKSEERPTMDIIIDKLEDATDFQANPFINYFDGKP
ncbi:hypothetical protein Lser_V15G06583 [Lactuca serriola]